MPKTNNSHIMTLKDYAVFNLPVFKRFGGLMVVLFCENTQQLIHDHLKIFKRYCFTPIQILKLTILLKIKRKPQDIEVSRLYFLRPIHTEILYSSLSCYYETKVRSKEKT